MYHLSDYTYDLPDSAIAQIPADPADSAKLLIPSYDGSFSDKTILDLPNILTENDVLFLNDTRVVQARIPLYNTRVVTRQGREVILDYAEIFFLEKCSDTRCEALISLLKRNRPWTKIFISDTIVAEIIELTNKGVILDVVWCTIDELLEKYGKMPLPPYIETTDESQKKYQTVFAKHDWSVAAPTASLHLTPWLLDSLEAKWIQTEYVTLHVWLWTFKPVDTSDIRDYHIHEETIIIDQSIFATIASIKSLGKKIVAVWTTVSRVLETLPYVYRHPERSEGAHGQISLEKNNSNTWDSSALPQNDTMEYRNNITKNIPQSDTQKYILDIKDIWDNKIQIRTRIFMYPWFEWKVVDNLMTNFHLPGSTLLMLVASFIWYDKCMRIYEYAVDHNYRFFSFGDAMLLQR